MQPHELPTSSKVSVEDLSEVEMMFYRAGFEMLPRGADDVCFRMFFRVSALAPLVKHRLMRMGLEDSDMVSVHYSETDNAVTLYSQAKDLFWGVEADSGQARSMLWGFGIRL